MKRLLLIISLSSVAALASGQNKTWNSSVNLWSYDLTGARDQVLTDINETVQLKPAEGTYSPGGQTSTTTSPGWFPAPPSAGSPSVVQVRATGKAQTQIDLIKEGGQLKSTKIYATNALSKWILRDIDNSKATSVAKYSFNLKTHYKDAGGNPVIPGFSRTYDLVFGSNRTGSTTSDQGSMFRGGNGISNVERLYDDEAVFTSFRLSYQNGDDEMTLSQRKVTQKYKVSPATEGTATWDIIDNPLTLFKANGSAHQLDFYLNNSDAPQYYIVNSTLESIPSQTLHLWVDGNKIGEFIIATAGEEPLAAGKTLDSFMVYTTGGTGGAALDEIGYGALELSGFKIDYAIIPTSNTLPVSLSDFSAKNNGNHIALSWKTLSEKNHNRFEVLRSADGVKFQEIVSLPGSGIDSDKINYYTAKDHSPLAGINYYMLKQVDYNGDFSESKIIAINTSLINETLQISKSDGVLNVWMQSTKSSVGKLRITDVHGRQLYNEQVPLIAGKNQFALSLSLFAPGVYIFTGESNGHIQRLKFVN